MYVRRWVDNVCITVAIAMVEFDPIKADQSAIRKAEEVLAGYRQWFGLKVEARHVFIGFSVVASDGVMDISADLCYHIKLISGVSTSCGCDHVCRGRLGVDHRRVGDLYAVPWRASVLRSTL